VIVGTQHQDRVFERDNQDQCPQDQRRHPEDCFGRQRPAGLGGLLERVERARADIAIDDAERRESGLVSCRGNAAVWTVLSIPVSSPLPQVLSRNFHKGNKCLLGPQDDSCGRFGPVLVR
jgi:hypothetical protein